jgi:hypothetical protein
MSRQSPRFRPVLDQFAGYKPGKAPSATAGDLQVLIERVAV